MNYWKLGDPSSMCWGLAVPSYEKAKQQEATHTTVILLLKCETRKKLCCYQNRIFCSTIIYSIDYVKVSQIYRQSQHQTKPCIQMASYQLNNTHRTFTRDVSLNLGLLECKSILNSMHQKQLLDFTIQMWYALMAHDIFRQFS